MRAKLTNQFIRSVESPAEGQTVIRDTETRGLLIKIGASARTFFVEHRVKGSGKKRLPKIGGFPEWTIEQARAKARELIVEMDKGNDPLAEARKAKEATGTFNPETFTVADALDYYIAQLKAEGKSKATIDHLEGETKRLLKPWANRPLLSIKKRECKALHTTIQSDIRKGTSPESLTDNTGNYAANRTMKYFQSAFNRVAYDFEDDGFPDDAVCPVRKGFKWHPEESRDVRVEWTALHDWWAATGNLDSPIRRDAWRLILLTGLRNADACSIHEDDVDFITGTLTRPEPKGGRSKAFSIPLSTEALAILKQRFVDNATEFGTDCKFAFPTRNSDGVVTHIPSLKEQVVRDRKKFRNKIIGCAHDLRRTFLTAGFESGISEIVLKLLANHSVPKRQSNMTKRYIVKVDREFLRKETQRITDFLLGHARVTLVDGTFKQSQTELKPAA
jgi:integrase